MLQDKLYGWKFVSMKVVVMHLIPTQTDYDLYLWAMVCLRGLVWHELYRPSSFSGLWIYSLGIQIFLQKYKKNHVLRTLVLFIFLEKSAIFGFLVLSFFALFFIRLIHFCFSCWNLLDFFQFSLTWKIQKLIDITDHRSKVNDRCPPYWHFC